MKIDKKVVIMVIDSLGIGALPDCKEYGDSPDCNTLANTAKAVGALFLKNFEKMGLGNIMPIEGIMPTAEPIADYGVMKMRSAGKDTTTGHWEMAGLVLDTPFKTYQKFPPELMDEFVEKSGCGGYLGNYASSGTEIIERLDIEHQKTGYPIVYTSADSVFQIAVDIDKVPVETLYRWCIAARQVLDKGWGVSRVIARPYRLLDGVPTRIGALRHDYSVPPPRDTVLNELERNGKKVLGIGKIQDIFVKSGVSASTPTKNNQDGLIETLKAIKESEYDLIFTNLVDTDMLYGHRRDPRGYARALKEINGYLPDILEALSENDLLIITADHGCDPTAKGTDHTREQVPVLVYRKNLNRIGKNLGTKESFAYVAELVREFFDLGTN
ncbi:phosphopentomutase [Candidatus Gastranaerophilus sp. (ex Termes propinquus)]|nr:phosphopentomutase [Candidatus Gastranaerophilus sp. (ex Termes propinquus)]